MVNAAVALESSYGPEARVRTKRDQHWTGYTVHLTETCDADLPHLLTQLETTAATVADVEHLAAIQQGLAQVEVLPAEQLVDAGCEGTLSQAVRAFGLRRARYRGLAKMHLQQLATAAAINVHRIANWRDDVPLARTRQSAFAVTIHAA